MKKRRYSNEDLRKFDELYNNLKNNKIVLKMKKFKHHRSFSAFDHSVSVTNACLSYALKSKHEFDIESLIKGAMLHDLFLYDWRDGEKYHRFHGYTHPEIALGNAMKYFSINEKEKDIILHHMWPLTLSRFPHSKEALLVSWMDKVVGFKECFKSRRKMLKESRQAFKKAIEV